MNYNEDLLPLADQVRVVFKLELAPTLSVLVTKYGKTLLSQKASKKEFSKEIKKGINKVLKNLSKNYLNYLLEEYWSDEGMALFISNLLIDLSKEYISEEITKLRNMG